MGSISVSVLGFLLLSKFFCYGQTQVERPTATMATGPKTIPVGGSVTLSCSVEPSAGWKYRWFRQTSDTTEVQIRTNNEENRKITVTQGGIYRCEGMRENPESYSESSDEVTVRISFSNKVVATQQPNRPQLFSDETTTLTCEVQGGETTEWMCEWRRPGLATHRANGKDWTLRLSDSSSGDYMCRCRRRDDWYSSTRWSEAITLSVSDKPRARLTAGSTTIPVGGSVTLSCSVEPSAGWKYRWFRKTSGSFVEFSTNKEENRDITVRQGGIYMCMGIREKTYFYSDSSDEVTIQINFSNKVFVTRQPNRPQIFSDETITLSCEVQGGETTEWTCEWRRDGLVIHRTYSKDWTFIVSKSSSGDYMCQCEPRDDWFSSTQWSEAISLSVSVTPAKPRAKLTQRSTTIPVGGSVTLSCSVEPSAGWKYRWLRRTSGSFVDFSTNKEENRDITVRQGGIYMCMGMREQTYFYSDSSDEVTIQINFSNKVFVTRQPNRPQIFSGESITLSCEVQGGETTEWTCEWKRDGSVIHRTNIKDWTFIVYESSSADYMCQCRPRDDWFSSTQWSEAISLSVSSKPKAQLNSNSREIPAGGSVTLTCTVDASSSGWKYFWYKERDSSELLTGGEADFPSNGQMSVSEEGLYWCRGGRGEPVYYTDYSVRFSITKNVTVSSSASSSFPVMFIIGPVVGIVLIILLLLLWRYRLSKDLSCLRSFQSDSSSQMPATNHGANESESHYRSLLHGTTSIYHIIRPGEAAGNDVVVKYAKRRERPRPEESCVYVNVMPKINSSA